MGQIRKSKPVKLIIGFIFSEEPVLIKTGNILEKRFGKIDFQSPALPFTFTDYYRKELGDNLKRKFIAFKRLIPAQNLPGIKTLTNEIENKLSRDGRRIINIDPGYLNLAKLVLATTKDYNHRIYLNKGIYAELTLFYRGKTFQPWEWTYPDYKNPEYTAIFNRIRQIYSAQIRPRTG